MRTYYSILGVPEAATQADIKAAYRILLKKIHPDTVAMLSPERMREANNVTQEIVHAYSVLSDANKRVQYDRYLSTRAPRSSSPGKSSRRHQPGVRRPSADSEWGRHSSAKTKRKQTNSSTLKIWGSAFTRLSIAGGSGTTFGGCRRGRFCKVSGE